MIYYAIEDIFATSADDGSDEVAYDRFRIQVKSFGHVVERGDVAFFDCSGCLPSEAHNKEHESVLGHFKGFVSIPAVLESNRRKVVG